MCVNEKVGKKLARIETSSDLSPAVCQDVAVSLTDTHTNLSLQHKLANISLMCEGRLTMSMMNVLPGL